MFNQITVPQWVSLKVETRQRLREIFLIPKSAGAEVVTDEYGKGKLISDGCTNEDLKAITVEKLRDYLGSAAVNESIYDLFARAVESIELPPEAQTRKVAPNNEPSKGLKCEKCEFRTASKFALRMHFGKKHKDKL